MAPKVLRVVAHRPFDDVLGVQRKHVLVHGNVQRVELLLLFYSEHEPLVVVLGLDLLALLLVRRNDLALFVGKAGHALKRGAGMAVAVGLIAISAVIYARTRNVTDYDPEMCVPLLDDRVEPGEIDEDAPVVAKPPALKERWTLRKKKPR